VAHPALAPWEERVLPVVRRERAVWRERAVPAASAVWRERAVLAASVVWRERAARVVVAVERQERGATRCAFRHALPDVFAAARVASIP
jgi:hypothetical protein